MNVTRAWTSSAFICALLLAGIGSANAAVIDIYIGNNASFAASATDSSSIQGFTEIRDRWQGSGATVNITDVFSPAGKDIFLATAPQSAWSPGQVSDLQSFLAGGGWLILSHDGFGGISNMNALLGDLGSSMVFGSGTQTGAGGTVTLNIDDPSNAFMQNMPDGPTLTSFSPGSVSGGNALASFTDPVIAFEDIGAGGILAVADFDLLNNATGLFFPASAAPNNHQFWDNILAGHEVSVPEPVSVLLLGAGLLGIGLSRRRPSAA